MVMDGHGSRECPLALYLLKCNSINVLILPAHTTHITQMFDVCLAHSLKRLAAKIMKKLIKENIANKDMTRISIIRKSAIMAAISAWVSICNPESCQKAARVTGFSPYNKNQIDNSKFVILRSKEEDDEYIKKRKERSRLDINGTIINTSSFIDKIIDRLVVHPKFNHLCYLPTRGITWTSIISKY